MLRNVDHIKLDGFCLKIELSDGNIVNVSNVDLIKITGLGGLSITIGNACDQLLDITYLDTIGYYRLLSIANTYYIGISWIFTTDDLPLMLEYLEKYNYERSNS